MTKKSGRIRRDVFLNADAATDGPNPNVCWAESADSCLGCCAGLYPAGYGKFGKIELGCACESTLCGPPDFVPDVATTLTPGLRITRHLEEALRGTDVIMLLRVQKERLAGQKIRLQDYIARYQMTTARLKLAKRDAILMHPGPIIRGLELTAEVADGPQSVIVDEVHNGVPTRMAILARALGKAK